MLNSSDVIAYAYHADVVCPRCTIDLLLREGKASPAARDMAPDDAVRQIVDSNGFDYDDLHTYDSDDLPKPITVDEAEPPEVCGECFEWILE